VACQHQPSVSCRSQPDTALHVHPLVNTHVHALTHTSHLLLAVLGGNLFGVTSWLLGLDGGKLAASTNLDVLVPVDGCRRCLDPQNGFTFLYPARWLADQTLYRRYAERIEREAALDPPSLNRARARRQGAPEPRAAYGPPGSTGANCNI
jgi:hypothetical protein